MSSNPEKPSRLTTKTIIICITTLVIGSLLFWNSSSQGTTFIYPYFSGAVNLGLDLSWKIDVESYANFFPLTYPEQLEYIFESGHPDNLIKYSILDPGYMFIVWIAQNLLFWLPQMKAVIWLQIFFHIASSLWVMSGLKTHGEKMVFFLSYAANPIILHFVTFAFYYYWQIIPVFAWYIYNNRFNISNIMTFHLLSLVLAVAFLIRQSTLIASLLILAAIAWKVRKFWLWLVLLLFFVFAILFKNPSQPWHTAYVGIGAYSNSAGILLSDQSGYKHFFEQTGILIEIDSPHGNLYDQGVREHYYSTLRNALVSYAKENPWQMIRNAVLNILQSFSAGYPVGYPILAYASALFGLIVLITLVKSRLYFIVGLCFANVAGFIFYFPPIPAYMFGNYFLLALALTIIISRSQKFISISFLRSN